MTNREDFAESFPEILSFLEANLWSNFCVELLAQVETRGSLTERQLDAIDRMAAKLAERARERQERDEAQKSNRATVDLSTVHRMFDVAKSNGLNKRCYRAEGLALSPAPVTGRNAGAIYAKRLSDGVYVGKIVADQFMPSREATPVDRAALVTIAENPAEAATRYGQRTGTCSLCGRELTREDSIARAMGPICASKWGFA